MNTIYLTDEELNNLRVFLGRCEIKVNEIPAILPILNKLSNTEVVKDGE